METDPSPPAARTILPDFALRRQFLPVARTDTFDKLLAQSALPKIDTQATAAFDKTVAMAGGVAVDGQFDRRTIIRERRRVASRLRFLAVQARTYGDVGAFGIGREHEIIVEPVNPPRAGMVKVRNAPSVVPCAKDRRRPVP